MRLDKAGRSYRVNGLRISIGALTAISKEIFSADGWEKILGSIEQNGCANVEFNPSEIQLSEDRNNRVIAEAALEQARRKIAALEKKVAELTISNIYSGLSFT